jgi:hypothetical protein
MWVVVYVFCLTISIDFFSCFPDQLFKPGNKHPKSHLRLAGKNMQKWLQAYREKKILTLRLSLNHTG